MPNTIAHLGVNLLATRAALPAAGTKWILAGALLPDLPWILQRLLRAGLPEIPAIDLRLYVAAQASLLGCLLLAREQQTAEQRGLRGDIEAEVD
ncbi:MAG: hypothetical protein AAFR52_05860, partial [Pseudomonadota bacterium]